MSSTEPLPVVSHGSLRPRRRERRMGVETLLAVVGRALARPANGPSLREAFEDVLGQVLPIRVTGHGGYAPGDIVSATFAFSYDGGTTWTDAAVSSNAGAWSAVVDHTGASGKTVTTRVEVTDRKGASVTQVVKAAYAVR